MEIITDTMSEAHEAAFDAIVSQHKEIDIQTHKDKKEFTLEFEGPNGTDDCITMHVLHPLQEPQVSAGTPFGEGFTAAYERQFLTLSPPRSDGNHAVYTYWNRLEDFQVMNCTTGMFSGDGKGDGFKQVTELIKKLASDPNSRRGVMVTWNPIIDANNPEPPCMDFLQVVIRNGKVHIRVVFRSQDIGLGLPENFVGVKALLVYITMGINRICFGNYEPGEITIISLIPHIYKKRDANYFYQMLAEINRKKTLGLWHPVVRA
jgi:thymidylate synthase